MKKIHLSIYFILLISLFGCSKKKTETMSQHGLQRLLDGNKRYVGNASEHPNRDAERRTEVKDRQTPFAIIVGCSDSRVCPAIVFDQGIGDLFVVRVAGNVIGPIELESIEFAALNLNSEIILVLGHQNCGAVTAVVENKIDGIEEIARYIEPAVASAEDSDSKSVLETAIKNNAINMRDYLRNSPNIKKLIDNNKIEVHAAYYELEKGSVEEIKD